MTVSALYVGEVSHRRLGPKPHSLRYRVFQLLLDLEEAETLSRRARLFSVNRFNLFSHCDADHGDGRTPLRAWVDARLAQAGIEGGGKILLLAMPRIFGHVFNPLSIYYCHDRAGRLTAIIHEVNNTFGERHAYVLATEPSVAGRVRQSCAKALRVSPFMRMDLIYDFDLTRPGDTVRTLVRARHPSGELALYALFAGKRRPLTDGALAVALISFPLMTLKVVAAIYLEAAKMWLKGLRPPRPAAACLKPASPRGV